MIDEGTTGMVIYTDGGCLGNPGPGGWAFVAELDGARHERAGFVAETTNNRMELTAVLEALRFAAQSDDRAQRSSPVDLFTDSRYVQQGITAWLPRWLANGWRTANKKPVKNRDLWTQLNQARADLERLEMHWVAGHAGVGLNERCHELVQEALARRR